MRMNIVVLLSLFCLGTVVAEEPPPLLGGGDATLRDVAGTSTLVTVVVKSTNAKDKNLKVLDVFDNYFSVVDENNVRSAYLFSTIKEVRVQGGRVMTEKFMIDDATALRPEEQNVVDRAWARAKELFNTTRNNQALKMQSAVLLSLRRDRQADEYLMKLVESNDLMTQLDAALCLYLAGQSIPDRALLTRGIKSGNRRIKTKAAQLSGLLGDSSNEGFLKMMLNDRSEELAVPAARALARLGNRECIPALLKLLTGLNEKKGEAAVFALTRLGGPSVVEQMKHEYENVTGKIRFRIAKVLFNLDDPMGRELMKKEFMRVPTLAHEAAILLAREGDWDAMQYLRNRLEQRFDPVKEALSFRARAAAALIEGGDASNVAILQELLRSDLIEIRLQVCELCAELGKKQLLTILQPPIESPQVEIAVEACTASIAIANPNDFRKRLNESRK